MSLLIPELESQLRDVIRARQSQGARPRRHRAPGFGVLAVAVSVGVALVLAVGALVLLGAHKQASLAAHPAVSHQSSRPQLIGILAVLRRRQTKEDLSLASRPQVLLEELPSPSLIDRPLVRLATTTPWGARVFLVPYKRRSASRGPRPTTEALAVFSSDGAEWSGVTVGKIEGGKAYVGFWMGNGRQSMYTAVGIVPDGVSNVTVYVGKTLRAVVHSNVFAVRWIVPGPLYKAVPRGSHHLNGAVLPYLRIRPVVTWYAPSGRQIKRFTCRSCA